MQTDWGAIIATLIGAVLGVAGTLFATWISGPRVKVRADLFCWAGTDNWKLIVSAINRGRGSGTVSVRAVQQRVVRGYSGSRVDVVTGKFLPERGQPMPCVIQPAAPPLRWVMDARKIHNQSLDAQGQRSNVWIIVERARFKSKRIKVRQEMRPLEALLDDELYGWSRELLD